MARDVLNKVNEAETRGRALVQSACDEAHVIGESIITDGKAILEKKTFSANAEAARIIDKASSEAHFIRDAAIADAKLQCDELAARACQNEDAVVKECLEMMLKN